MLIRITGVAEVLTDDDEPVVARSTIRKLDGAESDDVCSNYLDWELAELGLTGGKVKLTYDTVKKRFLVQTEYSSPAKLKRDQLKQLAADTAGQWSDGIGEACFDDLMDGLDVTIDLLQPSAKPPKVEQIDDGRTPTRSAAVVGGAARRGDLAALKEHLDAGLGTETRVLGYTPLQLAVLYGQAAAARELVDRGADLKARDPQGQDALTLAAVSTSLSDADAAAVATLLLERGVSVYGSAGPRANPTSGRYTPLYLAKYRKKAKLAAALRKFGATK